MHRSNRIGTRAGEYEITGVLGKGGMGTVYAGVHPVIGTKVAIKVLDPRLAEPPVVARFIQEARAVNKIRHPNIIEIFAFGESPELGHYFVMPLLEGQTLAERVQTAGPLAPAAALPILRQIAEALDAAHDAGIYHRDLKPENVVLADDGRGQEVAKVLDFGLAKLTDASSVAVTSEKFSMGTPLFMSPEQWAAVGSVDHRTDVYALGVVVHFVLTGRYPFEGQSPLTLMKLHTSEPPDPASRHGAPEAADAVIARALAKDREERYQRASELCAAFAAACCDRTVDPLAITTGVGGKRRAVSALASTEHAATTGGAARRSARGRFVAAGAAIALAAAVVAGGLYLSRGGAEEEPAAGRAPLAAPPQLQSDAAAATPVAAPLPDADAAPVESIESKVNREPRKRRVRRSPGARRPRRPDVHSTWGKTDDPF